VDNLQSFPVNKTAPKTDPSLMDTTASPAPNPNFLTSKTNSANHVNPERISAK
jgi:hypothetical protein